MASVEKNTFENNPLDTDALPKFEAVGLTRLSPKYLIKMNIGTGIFMLICFVGLSIAYIVFPEFVQNYLIYIIVVLILYFSWSFISNYQLQKRTGYALRERDIIFTRGFLFERTTVIPFNRVQHVSTNRGVLDKILGLSTLNIFTAGGSGSDISISGLLPNKADNLKEALSVRMSAHV